MYKYLQNEFLWIASVADAKISVKMFFFSFLSLSIYNEHTEMLNLGYFFFLFFACAS